MIKTCERGRQEHPVCGDRGSFMTGTMFFNMLLRSEEHTSELQSH